MQGIEDATQYLPPVPTTADSDATQFIAPVPQSPGPGMLPPESSSEATQYLPQQPPAQAPPSAPLPPQDSGSEATQYLPPVAAQPPQAAPGAAPYGVRPGAPGDRPPPAEFDSLFRTDGAGSRAGAGQAAGTGAGASQQPPQFGAASASNGHGRAQPAAVPYGSQQPPAYDQPQPGRTPGESRGRSNSRRPSSKVPLIAAVVIGCAVLGLGAGALMSGGDESSDDSKTVASESSATTEPSTQAEVDPAKPQAESLDKLLADSNNSRAAVIRAVENIKSCKNLDQAATDLHGAAEQRRDLVTRLEGLTLDKLPDHSELTASLTTAWQASASADDHYATWAYQAKNKKVCKGGHARATPQAQQGNKASGEATAAKQKASGLWNGLATKYGLTSRAPTQL